MEDGLSNPSATLWLALNSNTADSVFTRFTHAHISVCKKRNKALHAAKLAHHPSTTHARQVIDDSDLESEMNTEVVPDRAAASPIKWDAEVAPSKINRLKKPKKTTSTRRNSQSSARGAAKKASDHISNMSNVSAGTLDFYVKPIRGSTSAGPSCLPTKTIRKSRSGKLKAVPTSVSSPFRDL